MILEKIFDTFTKNNEELNYNGININNIKFNELCRIVNNVHDDNIIDNLLNDNNYKEKIFILLLSTKKDETVLLPMLFINDKKYKFVKIVGSVDKNEGTLSLIIMHDKIFTNKNCEIIGNVIYSINIDPSENIMKYYIRKIMKKEEDINEYNISLFLK